MSKKVEKRFLKGENEYRLNVDDIVKAVNTFDKEYGIKLKNPDVWNEPEKQIKILVENCNINLAAILVLINGIQFSNYFDESPYGTVMPFQPIGNDHPQFNEDSLLNWNRKGIKYDVKSIMFRARFISNVLQYSMGDFNKIINNSIKFVPHSKHEYGIVNCRDFMNYYIQFASVMIDSTEEYKNIILKMHEITSYKYKKVDYKDLKYKLNSGIINLRKNMEETIITDRFYSDDIAIYEILKIAYMLATNDTDFKRLPKFKYIENATVKHDLIKLIEELGNQIIAHNGYKKYPIMFRAFINANPLIMSEYSDEAYTNIAIRSGIAALWYTKFVCNNKEVSEFINNMLQKGI